MNVKSFRYSNKNMEKSFGKGAVMKLGIIKVAESQAHQVVLSQWITH